MTEGFKIVDRTAPEMESSRLMIERAELSTLGTRLFGAECEGSLSEHLSDGGLGYRASRGLGDVLDVIGIEIMKILAE